MATEDRKMNAFAQVTDAEFVYAEAADGSQVKLRKADILSAMNAFAEVTDAEYVYGELADGSQVKIRKADLFEDLFKAKDIFEGDADYLLTPGMYYTTGSTTNANGVTGLFVVFGERNSIFQIVVSVFDDYTYIRHNLYNNDKWDLWTNWKQI